MRGHDAKHLLYNGSSPKMAGSETSMAKYKELWNLRDVSTGIHYIILFYFCECLKTAIIKSSKKLKNRSFSISKNATHFVWNSIALLQKYLVSNTSNETSRIYILKI